ncbi:hypothetical protein AJ80_00275 [Polytolypa hystricis UAMH7299]|uniref:Uncharacterized protein n=1 Tax=Polytolypa hystricis (strain UAMH7299) TaxID=1447883 RepID=A0A2B7Z3N9_POLH7|nr:hypothetical protein AJ80_00275 [Polytolypa hystricis UAMH7299]
MSRYRSPSKREDYDPRPIDAHRRHPPRLLRNLDEKENLPPCPVIVRPSHRRHQQQQSSGVTHDHRRRVLSDLQPMDLSGNFSATWSSDNNNNKLNSMVMDTVPKATRFRQTSTSFPKAFNDDVGSNNNGGDTLTTDTFTTTQNITATRNQSFVIPDIINVSEIISGGCGGGSPAPKANAGGKGRASTRFSSPNSTFHSFNQEDARQFDDVSQEVGIVNNIKDLSQLFCNIDVQKNEARRSAKAAATATTTKVRQNKTTTTTSRRRSSRAPEKPIERRATATAWSDDGSEETEDQSEQEAILLEQLQQENSTLRIGNDTLEARLQAAEQEKADLKFRFEAVQRENKSIVAALEGNIQSAANSRRASVAKKDKVRHRTTEIETDKETLQTRAQDLQKRLRSPRREEREHVRAQFKNERTKLQNACDSLENRLEKTLKLLEARDSAIDILLEQRNNDVAQISDLKCQVKELTKASENRRETKVQLNEQRDSAVSHFGDVLKTLRAETRDLRSDNELVRLTNAQLVEQQGADASQISVLKSEIEQLRGESRQVRAANIQLTERIRALDSALSDIRGLYSEKKEKLDTLSDSVRLNIASLSRQAKESARLAALLEEALAKAQSQSRSESQSRGPDEENMDMGHLGTIVEELTGLSEKNTKDFNAMRSDMEARIFREKAGMRGQDEEGV